MNEAILNRVIRISLPDVEQLKAEVFGNEKIHTVEIDGTNIQSWSDYISVIEREFEFPTRNENMSGYKD